jgi:SAM-dependent methyltransferase
MFDAQTEQHEHLVNTIVTVAVQPDDYALLRHLSQVLNLQSDQTVLLIADRAGEARQVLIEQNGCQVETFEGDLRHLSHADATFDSVIVMRPLPQPLHAVAQELARVLKPNGTLGMFIFNVHPDQVFGKAAFEHTKLLTAISRPAATYRAVLAESGFTAFVSENRRRSLRQTSLESYRQHMLQSTSDALAPAKHATSRALALMASGSVSVTIITAEKAI